MNTVLEELCLEALLINCPISGHNPNWSPDVFVRGKMEKRARRGDISRGLNRNMIVGDFVRKHGLEV